MVQIFGAIVADSWLGRYNAILVFSFVYIAGLLVLFCTSLPTALDHGAGTAGLIVTMIILGIGTGGIKANVSPLIAEQYTETKCRTKVLKNGERVIIDPAITVQSLYNIFYWCINIGSLSAIATVWMEKKIDFWAVSWNYWLMGVGVTDCDSQGLPFAVLLLLPRNPRALYRPQQICRSPAQGLRHRRGREMHLARHQGWL